MIGDLQLLAEAVLRLIVLGAVGFAFAAVGAYLFVCATGKQPKGGAR